MNVNRVDMIANRMGDLTLSLANGIRISLKYVNMCQVRLGTARHRDDYTGAEQFRGSPDDNGGMLTLEFGRVGVVREIHPVVLTDAWSAP